MLFSTLVVETGLYVSKKCHAEKKESTKANQGVLITKEVRENNRKQFVKQPGYNQGTLFYRRVKNDKSILITIHVNAP